MKSGLGILNNLGGKVNLKTAGVPNKFYGSVNVLQGIYAGQEKSQILEKLKYKVLF